MRALKRPKGYWISEPVMARELVNAGEWFRKADDFYEDLGGHIIHESSAEMYFDCYIDGLTADERKEVLNRLTRGGEK